LSFFDFSRDGFGSGEVKMVHVSTPTSDEANRYAHLFSPATFMGRMHIKSVTSPSRQRNIIPRQVWTFIAQTL